ncbi:MAG: family 43 glycosylhydrolase [Opitutaceae bacterium]|nr:family 43 glycosylhydrolase [Opitutaceae bacterium]
MSAPHTPSPTSTAGNPILPGLGACDPHIHIFGDRAYLYASHDKAPRNDRFIMEDWWVWSSADLVNWRHECTIHPEQTYIARPFDGCWATDAAERDGKYFFYFSEANRRTGVLVGDSPAGPWRDPLGRPLLTGDEAPTHPYDACVFVEADGAAYIIFGVWDYHIARLGDDLVSLAEKPRRLEITDPWGPYGPGKTDDKPSLHRHGDVYYLSWGCFYATGASPYGPFQFRGCVLQDSSFHDGTAAPTWPHGYRQGRHGSFFAWHGQTYFAYCDISQTGNRYFRDTFISYVHHHADGRIAPVRVDLTGVGRYDAARGPIQAEDYFRAEHCEKLELPLGGFGVRGADGARLHYPNLHGLAGQRSLTLAYLGLAQEPAAAELELVFSRENTPQTVIPVRLPAVPRFRPASLPVDLDLPPGVDALTVRFGKNSAAIALDAFTFSARSVSELSPPALFAG